MEHSSLILFSFWNFKFICCYLRKSTERNQMRKEEEKAKQFLLEIFFVFGVFCTRPKQNWFCFVDVSSNFRASERVSVCMCVSCGWNERNSNFEMGNPRSRRQSVMAMGETENVRATYASNYCQHIVLSFFHVYSFSFNLYSFVRFPFNFPTIQFGMQTIIGIEKSFSAGIKWNRLVCESAIKCIYYLSLAWLFFLVFFFQSDGIAEIDEEK